MKLHLWISHTSTFEARNVKKSFKGIKVESKKLSGFRQLSNSNELEVLTVILPLKPHTVIFSSTYSLENGKFHNYS
jgi:hypothetical protein